MTGSTIGLGLVPPPTRHGRAPLFLPAGSFVRSLARFRGDSSVSRYAHQEALRGALHARRRFEVRDRVSTSNIESPEPIETINRSPLETAVSRERRRVVRSLFERLPEPTAEALAMHFVLGYTVEEIASIAEVSPNTVWSRLKLGKKALRRALENDRALNEFLQRERT